ncbi:hypothetical protein IAI10_11480 [Clostridium sp. 19966]|uniref:hypothetical protein n=1 Tax=Clostridium sp. 19966 TaxID=2768166 RepID=UPI0028DE5AAB|nr:hypothetical protein [Clostridium sp. 19966]MDT8717280.1 hypothetical protein [Clostridium sp. 19966]
MIKKGKKISLLLAAMIISASTAGCSKINEAEVKLGFKNTDFEYIKNNKADKVVIANTRDVGYKFTVTDKSTIMDLYDILSSAKKAEQKSQLDPDYTLEIYEGKTINKFNYVVGVDKKNYGNLYDNQKTYIVSSRLDNDIIKHLWDIRIPNDFKTTYYGTIIQFMKQHKSELTKNGGSIGVNIFDDTDVVKYMLSMEIEEFKSDISKTISSAQLVNKNKDNFDVLITMGTQGYKTNIYKSIIDVTYKKDNSEKKYYVVNKYQNGSWDVKITDSMPDGF